MNDVPSYISDFNEQMREIRAEERWTILAIAAPIAAWLVCMAWFTSEGADVGALMDNVGWWLIGLVAALVAFKLISVVFLFVWSGLKFMWVRFRKG